MTTEAAAPRLPDSSDYAALVDAAYDALLLATQTYQPGSTPLAYVLANVLGNLAYDVQQQTSRYFIERELHEAHVAHTQMLGAILDAAEKAGGTELPREG